MDVEKAKIKIDAQPEIINSDNTNQEMFSSNHKMSTESSVMPQDENLVNYSNSQQQYIKDVTHTFESSLIRLDKEKSIIEDFENKFSNKKYSSVWELSPPFMDPNLKTLWESKVQGFFFSAGTELLFNRQNKGIQPMINPATQFGINIQYSS